MCADGTWSAAPRVGRRAALPGKGLSVTRHVFRIRLEIICLIDFNVICVYILLVVVSLYVHAMCAVSVFLLAAIFDRCAVHRYGACALYVALIHGLLEVCPSMVGIKKFIKDILYKSMKRAGPVA